MKTLATRGQRRQHVPRALYRRRRSQVLGLESFTGAYLDIKRPEKKTFRSPQFAQIGQASAEKKEDARYCWAFWTVAAFFAAQTPYDPAGQSGQELSSTEEKRLQQIHEGLPVGQHRLYLATRLTDSFAKFPLGARNIIGPQSGGRWVEGIASPCSL